MLSSVDVDSTECLNMWNGQVKEQANCNVSFKETLQFTLNVIC